MTIGSQIEPVDFLGVYHDTAEKTRCRMARRNESRPISSGRERCVRNRMTASERRSDAASRRLCSQVIACRGSTLQTLPDPGRVVRCTVYDARAADPKLPAQGSAPEDQNHVVTVVDLSDLRTALIAVDHELPRRSVRFTQHHSARLWQATGVNGGQYRQTPIVLRIARSPIEFLPDRLYDFID